MTTSLKFLLFLLTVSSCATLQNGKRETITVKGSILAEQPVCANGSQEKGSHAPIANASYYLKMSETNDPAVHATRLLKTDENGLFSIRLQPGTYAVLHADKLLSYKAFRLKHAATSTYMKDRDESCFEKWYASADFMLKVSSDTTVSFVAKSRCYTYTNPCWEYTGPK